MTKITMGNFTLDHEQKDVLELLKDIKTHKDIVLGFYNLSMIIAENIHENNTNEKDMNIIKNAIEILQTEITEREV